MALLERDSFIAIRCRTARPRKEGSTNSASYHVHPSSRTRITHYSCKADYTWLNVKSRVKTERVRLIGQLLCVILMIDVTFQSSRMGGGFYIYIYMYVYIQTSMVARTLIVIPDAAAAVDDNVSHIVCDHGLDIIPSQYCFQFKSVLTSCVGLPLCTV